MKPIYSDEDLTAYLDGELTPDRAAKIEAAATDDADLAGRIEALTVGVDALSAAFEPMLGVARTRNLDHKLECAMAREAAQNRQRANRFARLVPYAAAFVLGIAGTWAFLTPRPDWRVEVAHYQALYVADTLSPIQPDMARLKAEFERASQVLGLPLDPEAFAAIDGLQLLRAQVLGFEGIPLVQIAFILPDGTPFAFCILHRSGKDTLPETDVLIGLAATSWSSETHQFLAIGGDNLPDVLEVSEQFRDIL